MSRVWLRGGHLQIFASRQDKHCVCNPRVNLTGQGYCGRLSVEANTARNVMKCTCKPFEYPAGSICAHCIREEEYRLYGTPEQLERELVSLSARPRSLSVFVP